MAAAVEGFFWPKIFWDFLTKNLDGAVKPFPFLQIINLVLGIVIILWEWPLGIIAKTALHRSIEARLVVYPVAALAAALLYQATNPAIYYTIGVGVYFWAYSEGEVSSFCQRNNVYWSLTSHRSLSQSHGLYHLATKQPRSKILTSLLNSIHFHNILHTGNYPTDLGALRRFDQVREDPIA